MKKSLMERHLRECLCERRTLAPQVEKAEALLESLNDAVEDNESTITNLRDCLKRGLYEGGAS